MTDPWTSFNEELRRLRDALGQPDAQARAAVTGLAVVANVRTLADRIATVNAGWGPDLMREADRLDIELRRARKPFRPHGPVLLSRPGQ